MNGLAAYALALGDDALVLAQRCGEWITRAPQLEEDVALANIGLDQLGQARTLLTYAGEVEGGEIEGGGVGGGGVGGGDGVGAQRGGEGKGRSEDDLAFLRDERAFTNVQLVELPNDDFAVTMARLLVFSSYQLELYSRLAGSADATLAAIAAKALKEVAYHRDHASNWVARLGDGTEESHARMRAGMERVWPYTGELFDGAWIEPGLVEAGIAVDPAVLRAPWEAHVLAVLEEAMLELPAVPQRPTGGRRGIHTEAMGYLLAEMQHLHRAHPGATW